MRAFYRLLMAEIIKLRRSALLRLIWLMPLLFLTTEWFLLERPSAGLRTMTPALRSLLEGAQIQALVAIWGGFFYPLLLALLPALLFRPEHGSKSWKHLFAQPTSRRSLFLVKAFLGVVLCGTVLALLGLLLWIEREFMGWWNPILALPFHGIRVAKLLGWLWLGSFPVMAIYLWVSHRISSTAIPVVFGIVGLLLTVALTGQELAQPWRRDLIPWVLPYALAERSTHTGVSQQEAHLIAKPFQAEPNVLRLPSGRKIRTWQNIPDEELFPPPPPTPLWLFSVFSVAGGLLFLALGWADAGRNRL